MLEFIDIKQNTDEWLELRGGLLTSSKLGTIMANYGKAFGDMQRRVPCLERIKAATGYEPKMSLEQTLEIIIDHFKGEDR